MNYSRTCPICEAIIIQYNDEDSVLYACGHLANWDGDTLVSCSNTCDVMTAIKEDLSERTFWPRELLDSAPECSTCLDSHHILVRGVEKDCPKCCVKEDRIFSCSTCGGTGGQHASSCGERFF